MNQGQSQLSHGARSRAATDRPRFGEVIRRKRLEKGLSLRSFAKLVGVSPAYICFVERGRIDPPTVERVDRMAGILGEPAHTLIALSGRIPEDLLSIIRAQPVTLTLLREIRTLTREQVAMLIEQARLMGAGNGGLE